MENIDENVATPNALAYSDTIQVGVPAGDLQYIVNLPNNGASFKASQTVNFSINVPHGSMADMKRSFIRFNIKNNSSTSGEDLYLDRACGGVAVIDSMKILGTTGQVISDIQQYNALVAMLNDYSNGAHVESSLNLMEGCATASVGGTPVIADGTTTTLSTREKIAISKSRVITHIPKGGFFNADKYLPLGMLNGQVQIQIGLANGETPFTMLNGKSGADWEVNGWELHIPIIKVSEEFQSNFRQLMASGVNMSIHTVDFTNNQATIASGSTGQQEILFANRKRSAKSVFVMNRRSANLTQPECESVSARQSCGTLQYQFSIAGTDMPSQPVKGQLAAGSENYGEYYAQMQRALGHFGSTFRGSCADTENYMPAADNSKGGLVVFALDLEAYSGVLAGKNLSSAMPLIYKPTLSTETTENIAKSHAVSVSAYTAFDSMLVVDGVTGSLTAVN
tara:strand:- start:546 stop:1901 length:1356 start_codon:yes stop_codon:yes gene_type:complete